MLLTRQAPLGSLPSLSSVLPFGARWMHIPALALLGFAAAYTLTSWYGNLVARDLARLPEGVHWTERARYATMARAGGILALVALFVSCIPLWKMSAPVWLYRKGSLVDIVIAAGALGVIAAGREREAILSGRAVSLTTWLRAKMATHAIHFSPLYVAIGYTYCCCLFEGQALWAALGATPLVVALGAAVLSRPSVMCFFGWARPGTDTSIQTTASACALMGKSPVRTLEIPLLQANAVALPLWNTIGYTDGALAALPDDALVAIAAHEVAHLEEPRSWAYQRLLSTALVATPLPFVSYYDALPESFALPIVGGVSLLAVLALRFRRQLGRRAEEAADERAGGLLHGTYARALERVYELNLMPAVTSKAAVHPNLYDRMLAAGMQPSYPRPALPLAPARYRGWRRAFAGWAQLLVVCTPIPVVAFWWAVFAGCRSSASDACLYLVGGGQQGLVERAEARLEANDYGAAATLVRAASQQGRISYRAYDIATSALSAVHDCVGLEDFLVHLEDHTQWRTRRAAIDAHKDILDALEEEHCPPPDEE
jgi:Zn-dependent protease with chaperone function